MAPLVPTSYAALPHIPLLLHQDKFVQAAKLFGYRVVHIPYDPCPEGSGGCVLCRGDRVGLHRREPLQSDVTDQLVHDRADGLAPLLSHRFRQSAVVITARVAGLERTLSEGEHFQIERGREVVWLTGARPDYQSTYAAAYRALSESWVHMQHAYGDFGGLKRKSEQDKFERLGHIPQGSVLMSIQHNAPGYDLMTGDVFVPVDGSVRAVRHLVAGRNSNRSQYRFVHEITRAYAVDQEARAEYDVDISFDPLTLQFSLSGVEDETKVAVIHRAAPQYFVYLDGGEFRNPMGQDHQRLVILSRLETSV